MTDTRVDKPAGAPAGERRPRLAPGPPGLPLLGNVRDVDTDDLLTAFLDMQRRYGDLVRMTFGPRTTHFVFGPEGIRHILQDNNKNYIKGRALAKSKDLLGEGLLTSEGEHWRGQRRLIQPMFNHARVDALGEQMSAHIQAMLNRWEARLAGTLAGEPVDISREMTRLTLEIVTGTLFSSGIRPEETGRIAVVIPRLMAETNRRVKSLTAWRERLPLPANRRFRRDIQAMEAIVYRIIAERRGQRSPDSPGGETASLLDLLISSGMGDRQLRDEVMTLFMAGHETTAALLSWAFMLLSQHPDQRRRLLEEIGSALGGRIPAAADMEQLPGLQRAISETLRLYPPAWSISRMALGPDRIGDCDIPAGSGMILSPYVVHRNPAYWDDPEGFDPDRFLPEASAGRPRYAYLPFGGGPRLCIGNHFALLEAGLVLASVLPRFELNLVPGRSTAAKIDFTLRPARGIWMHLRKVG